MWPDGFLKSLTIANGEALCRIDRRDVCLRPWGEDAGAWQREWFRGWSSFAPAIRLGVIESRGPSVQLSPARARLERLFGFLVAAWPEEARRRVRPFPAAHWELLLWLNHHGEHARQLLDTNPALAYLVATAGDKEGTILQWRRRDIAARFGFPANEAAVRLLAKLPSAAVTPRSLDSLRQALASPEANAGRLLSHFPRLQPGVLEVVREEALRAVVPAPLLTRLARRAEAPQFDGVSQLRARFVAAPTAPPPRTPAARPLPSRTRDGPRFPSCPIPPIEGIEPILTAKDLREEGRTMEHCAGSYVPRVTLGRIFFYRVTVPERATISIVPQYGRWVLEQAKGPRNAPVTQETVRWIRNWLASQPGAIPLPPPRFAGPTPLRLPRRPHHPGTDQRQLSFDFATGAPAPAQGSFTFVR